jgi:hypothetical protein
MILRMAAIVFLLVGSASYSQGNHSQRVPQFVYGQWTITKFAEVGGHAGQTKERAQEQIGKTLRIGNQSFDHDSKFLWFEDSCKNASYRMQTTDNEKGSLGFHGLEQQDGGQFLVVSCSKRDMYFLELAKNEELAVYHDGWFFFLRKTKGTL